MQSKRQILLIALILLAGSIALGMRRWSPTADRETPQPPTPISLESAEGMIRLPSGSFAMGSPYASDTQNNNVDTHPQHRVRLQAFWLDTTPVSNRQFEQFVEQTAYETEAERRGSSLIFDRNLSEWREVVGVNWRHPDDPDSSLVGKENHPVVHITWQDASTYAAWAGKRLPTEAEFEYAARGGLSDCMYPWGRELVLDEQPLANGWQGHFPQQDSGQDGYRGTSPAKQFPPNRFGLYDIAGNAWNWCSDWYDAEYYGASLVDNPLGPTSGTERVRRGGSWLSASNYGGGLRVASRDHAPPGESTNHTGFRCARSETQAVKP